MINIINECLFELNTSECSEVYGRDCNCFCRSVELQDCLAMKRVANDAACVKFCTSVDDSVFELLFCVS